MECRYIQSKFPAWVDGDLLPCERDWVREHLRECSDCADALHEVQYFLQTCDEFLVCPGETYSFEHLRARMAAIEPLEEVVAFLPKLRVNAVIPRFAVAMLFLLCTGGLPGLFNGTRHAYTAAKSPFTERVARLEAATEGLFPEDQQVRADKGIS